VPGASTHDFVIRNVDQQITFARGCSETSSGALQFVPHTAELASFSAFVITLSRGLRRLQPRRLKRNDFRTWVFGAHSCCHERSNYQHNARVEVEPLR
jgi:hypothetical protein